MEYDFNFIRILRSLKKSDCICLEQLAKALRINIKPDFIKVFVFGKLFNPTTIVFSRYSSLNDAIFLAGGAKLIKGPVKFISNEYHGTIETKKFVYRKKNKRGALKNPLLKSSDILRLKRNIVNVATELLDELARTFIGGYPAEEVFAKFWNYL